MLRTEFGEKCIILHFLGMEKDRKTSQCRDAEPAEKRFEEDQSLRRASKNTTPAQIWVVPAKLFSAKSFICITITHRSL